MEESDYDEENENPDLVEEELDPENPQHAFAILERDYTKVNVYICVALSNAKFLPCWVIKIF